MHIALILPFDMTARYFLETNLLKEMLAYEQLTKLYVIARTPLQLPSQCEYVQILRPFRYSAQRPLTLRRLLHDAKFTAGYFVHLSLVNRFNSIHHFRGFADRLKQSWKLRKREIKEGHPSSRIFGWPLPESRKIYGMLQRFYYRTWSSHPDITEWFAQAKPDGVVLGHMQNSKITAYLATAQKLGIRVIGMNGSWDQPTSKGPIMPFDGGIIVQNEEVKKELHRYHEIEESRLHVCGWPQMDRYVNAQAFLPREQFLSSIELPKDARYILFGAYSERLGPHEPMVLERLAEALQRGEFGENIWIWVRCHPLDRDWEERFSYLSRYVRLHVEPPSLGNLSHLANLLKHASLVISSAGTIALDAVALDTPAIALAYEDERLTYYDRPARRYDMEHYATAVATGGMWKVATMQELTNAIRGYLENRMLHAAQREALRSQFLEPFDGRSAMRTAQRIAAEVGL